MANLVKPKLTISLFCLAVLILIPLLETNFYATVTAKRWGSPLTWLDFAGIAPPFSKYDAAINSYIYLEYDSASSRYFSYAAQLDMHSWTRVSEGSENLLNHEQYHFNITEVHARIMNDYIKKYPDKREYDYRMKLAELRGELKFMQDIYDKETNHSINFDKQSRWEYTIDSLLLNYSSDSGWVNDYYSGGRIYFPSTPKFETTISKNHIPYRRYELSRYGMTLSFTCFQHPSYKGLDLSNFLNTHYLSNGLKIKSYSQQEPDGEIRISVIAEDSAKTSYHELWTNRNANLYKVEAKFSKNTFDTIGYSAIAQSFIKSFSIAPTNQHWLRFVKENSAPDVTVYTSSKTKQGAYKLCLLMKTGESRGFYGEPLYAEDGSLLLPYDILEQSDSLVYENILFINNKTYTFKADTAEIIYSIPIDKQPVDFFTIDVGFTLKTDSGNCRVFYRQTLQINPG